MVRALLDGVCRASVGDPSALDDVAALYADPENPPMVHLRGSKRRNGTRWCTIGSSETPCIWVTRVREGRIVEARDYNGQSAPVVR